MIKALFNEVNLKPINVKAVFFGGILLILFLFLSFLEVHGFFRVFDPVTTLFLQSESFRTLDVPLSIFSLLGSFEFISVAGLIIAFFMFRKHKKIPYSLAFFGVILIFEFIGKIFIHHIGPPQDFFRYVLPFSLPTSYVQTGNSFPSGHVSRTIFLIIVLWNLFGSKKILFKAILFTLGVIMVYSRIYLGEHWLSDTLGGVLLGGSMGLFTIAYFKHE